MPARSFLLVGSYLCCAVFAAGYTTKELKALPDEVRFAANIQNNMMAGGFKNVLNWTSKYLGHDRQTMMKQCSKSTRQDERLCAEVPMPTPWSASVDLDSPLPDYPRPQLRREHWLSLNGIWEFKSRGIREVGREWSEKETRKIVVPFPVEAPLSGVANHDVNNIDMLYARNFTVPSAWTTNGNHILLHFDAVDHSATVYLNGHKLGTHEGGYDRFSFDVTEYLVEGSNELVVNAYDPTEMAHIPCGKQRLHPPRHPSGIFYTSSSGIWQTVWLEPVPAAHITKTEVTPDIDNESLIVKVHGSSAAEGVSVSAVVSEGGKELTSGRGKIGEAFTIKISKPKLWSPDTPYLYDLEISLVSKPTETQSQSASTTAQASALKLHLDHGRRMQGWGGIFGKVMGNSKEQGHTLKIPKSSSGDSVASYFAMRKSSMGRTADGGLRPLLNNKFIFQTGMLDQGFWPDGLYTPASDDALIFDLKLTKELGFNMLRKHTKVESDRWYYHADRLGVLVWQDIPSMFYQSGAQDLSQQDKMSYRLELQRIMQQHYNFPSIMTWVVFNEGWGQHDTVDVVKYALSLDSTRVMDAASGWTDFPIGDLVDMHNYVGPGSPMPTENRAAVLGEYGGLGRKIEGHMWIPDDAFAYEMHLTASSLEERYKGLAIGLANLMTDKRFHLSASVYTEVSDVEAEINGWVTYDRKVKKVNPEKLAAYNKALIDKSKAIGMTSDKPTHGHVSISSSSAKLSHSIEKHGEHRLSEHSLA